MLVRGLPCSKFGIFMRYLVYDVASSLDGYIAAPGDDISAFPLEGDHVAAYHQRLASYNTVVMGRRTYEFGYGFGLKPGMRAYPHMRHFIFSRSLSLPKLSQVDAVSDNWLQTIDALKAEPGKDIYLCGGGAFAGYLLAHGRIDRVFIKLAPVVFGSGIPLFANLDHPVHLNPTQIKHHKSGVTLLEYRMNSAVSNAP